MVTGIKDQFEHPETIRSRSFEKRYYPLRNFTPMVLFKKMRIFPIVTLVVIHEIIDGNLQFTGLGYPTRFKEDICLRTKAKSLTGLKSVQKKRGLSLRNIVGKDEDRCPKV